MNGRGSLTSTGVSLWLDGGGLHLFFWLVGLRCQVFSPPPPFVCGKNERLKDIARFCLLCLESTPQPLRANHRGVMIIEQNRTFGIFTHTPIRTIQARKAENKTDTWQNNLPFVVYSCFHCSNQIQRFCPASARLFAAQKVSRALYRGLKRGP